MNDARGQDYPQIMKENSWNDSDVDRLFGWINGEGSVVGFGRGVGRNDTTTPPQPNKPHLHLPPIYKPTKFTAGKNCQEKIPWEVELG